MRSEEWRNNRDDDNDDIADALNTALVDDRLKQVGTHVVLAVTELEYDVGNDITIMDVLLLDI